MYKSSSKFSQRETRSNASVLANDKISPSKINRMKEFKPLKGLLKRRRKTKEESLRFIQSSKEIFKTVEDYGGYEKLRELLKIIDVLDKNKIRHPKAISLCLKKMAHISKSGNIYTYQEIQLLISLLNKVFTKKR